LQIALADWISSKEKWGKFQTKKTTDWRLVNQSLRRRTDEEIIRLCDIVLMQLLCHINEKINKI
jgi:hypothetical protein